MPLTESQILRRKPLTEYARLTAEMQILDALVGDISLDAAWEKMEALRKMLGLDYITFVKAHREGTERGITLGYATDVVRPAVEEYQMRGVAKNDPGLRALTAGASRVQPDPNFKTKTDREKDALADLMQLFSDHGITGHVAYRFRLPGSQQIVYIGAGMMRPHTNDDFQRLIRRAETRLRMAGTLFVAKAAPELDAKASDALSPAETLVMGQLSRGLTPVQIAEANGKALSTVRTQIYSAQSNLGASTVTQAVVMADRLGILKRE